MECICAEDFQESAIAYCACNYPLPPLCKVHAEKHSADNAGFHFLLPLSANEVITSEAMYMEAMEWLIRLNNNYKLLRKMLNQIANGEGLIESAYLELLHFASEANVTLKQEFSVMKEHFNAEVEKAIHQTSVHALERYTPVTPLEKLLWNNKPIEMPDNLFAIQTEGVKEEIPSAFRVVFQCTLPGFEQFSIGEKRQRNLLEKELQEVTIQLQDTEHQFQTLRADFASQAAQLEMKKKRCIALEIENEALKQQLELQTSKLKEVNSKPTYIGKWLVLMVICSIFLNITLGGCPAQRDKAERDLAEANKKNSILETRLKSWGITSDPPSESQEPLPDYSTPESRAVLTILGPYSGQDRELVLVRRGSVRRKDGVYIGQWNSRNETHGFGKYLFTNGDIYEGQWLNDSRSGVGRYIWANGTIYIGEFLQNQITGMGTKYLDSGRIDSGRWMNGTLHGLGAQMYPEDSELGLCSGEFVGGNFNGLGSCFWRNGEIYAGSWESNQRHGKGIQFWESDSIYFGDWENDQRSGKGSYVGPLILRYPDRQVGLVQQRFGERRVNNGVWVDDKYTAMW